MNLEKSKSISKNVFNILFEGMILLLTALKNLSELLFCIDCMYPWDLRFHELKALLYNQHILCPL